MSEHNGSVPDSLPVVPLRSTLVFPAGGALSIHLGMAPTLELLAAYPEETLRVVTVVEPGAPSEPMDPNALVKIGVLSELSDRLNVPGGVVRAVLNGLKRVRIRTVDRVDGYFMAHIEEVEERPADADLAEELIARVLTTLEALSDEAERLPKEVPAILRMNVGDPGRFADLVATLANFTVRRRDEVLQRLDIGERLRLVLEVVEEEFRNVRDYHAARRQAGTEPRAEQAEGRPRTALELRRRIKQLQARLGEVDPVEREAVDLLRRVDAARLPGRVANHARLEVEHLRTLGTATAQAIEIREHVDWLLHLPWTHAATAGPAGLDLAAVENALNQRLLGLDEPKQRLLDYLAVARLKGDLSGPIPCIVGPPDTGKTALAAAIAEGLGRPLCRIELRGRGEADIVGERRARGDATPGHILAGLRDVGARDPVIVLEELDFLGHGRSSGDPAAAMQEVLDWRTRRRFIDRFLEMEFDLSDVVFVATAQDFFRIPHDLRELLLEIRIAGYTPEEKVEIAHQMLLPRLVRDHGLEPQDVDFDDDALFFLARGYARDSGLEGLRRALSTLLRTRARAKAEGDGSTWHLEQERIIDILGLPLYSATVAENAPEVGVVTGLAWTEAGGEIMFIEALHMPGAGQLLTTGFLGDVMQESVVAAYSYVRSRADALGIPDEVFLTTDIHVHFPVGAVPKDGPSAGAAVTLALASTLSNRAVRHDIALTGEVTLRGRILEIGGLKEKVLAAYRAGLRQVILPAANERDLRDVPADVLAKMEFHFVETMDQVLALALLDGPTAADMAEPARPSRKRKAATGKGTKRRPGSG
ncbi:MAG TPA: S16 family serine protease [Longimicrobiales bacterium]|nr:S16 family serine protease [Longimicrobiales bacterium]